MSNIIKFLQSALKYGYFVVKLELKIFHFIKNISYISLSLLYGILKFNDLIGMMMVCYAYKEYILHFGKFKKLNLLLVPNNGIQKA